MLMLLQTFKSIKGTKPLRFFDYSFLCNSEIQLEQPAFSFHATILPIFCSSLPKIRQKSILYFSNIPQIKRFQFWYGSCMI